MIGIISDTHDNTTNIQKAVKIFRKNNVDFVIHLGDVVAPISLGFFEGLKLKVIQGNCDGDPEGMKKRLISMNSEFLGKEKVLLIEGKTFYLAHGNNEDRLLRAIKSNKYNYVLHGHTHIKRDDRFGKTRVINPGNHYLYHKQNHFIALLDVKTDNLKFVKI
jgi:hypothetical protein